MTNSASRPNFALAETFASDPAGDADFDWFKKHKGRAHRLRPPGRIEQSVIPIELRPTPRHLAYVVVRRIEDEVTCRMPAWLVEYDFDDDDFARDVFERAWLDLHILMPSPPAMSENAERRARR